MDNNSIHHGTGCRSAACTLLAAPARFKQQLCHVGLGTLVPGPYGGSIVSD